MGVQIVHLQRDNLLHEYGLDTQRLKPWAVLNSPFESSWAVAAPRTRSTLHSHHEHEIFIAVRGSAVIECDGEQALFAEGDVAFFQPGKQHRLLNDGDDEFMFYSVWWDEKMSEEFLHRSRSGARS
ncbi:mannose-6-phosphate isomerase-like protein (cupin superfamily) [Kibdelosporangium banguiense]|uniref:Mannose-6-phosphate isomerase-like protein (Cupin superfamily) n=1 Tax=Kibdelosporangium banguiense TaxID=1365924 RepID=A0ABS4TQ01_9PSEU|nr:cupin domain-containing protein [Kibdelosporangium banguiense]MBP2326479.1 mannose-6-phosphate isomerase-like protein (cupin superfamily) [Kibdelosporangium banguiense]